MATILISEFHELLYILGVCLLFLVISPKAFSSDRRRKLLYVGILAIFSACYFGFETIDSRIFPLHLMPIMLMLATLFEGAMPGIVTWAAFVLCGILFGETDAAGNIVSNSASLILGLRFHYRSYRKNQIGLIIKYALLNVAVAMTIYVVFARLNGYTWRTDELLVIVIGSLVSATLVAYTFYRVKNQEKLQQELYNAEKYHLIGQLAASISHEVRNPLTMTSGFLQMMGKPGIGSETLERYRVHAIEGVANATSIISDYLNFAKPAVEETKPINVRAEIEAVMAWISPLATMSCIETQVLHEDDADEAHFMGELKKFQQCLLNLLKNAIEAMPDGGKLIVATKLKDGYVNISIADTGVGMSKLQMKRIGTPFFTTKEKGTGLGLMVVVSLVKVMGGQITFSSKRGQGTVCVLSYPLCNA